MLAMPDTPPPSSPFPAPPPYFADALADAERLLKYAAESGMSIDNVTRDAVLDARVASSTGWTEEAAANLITALSKLAALASPVTAASLLASSHEFKPTVRGYLITAICLAVFIVPFSVASFLVTAISNTLNAEITTANALAVELNTQIRPPETASPAIAPQASAIQTPAASAPAVPAPHTKVGPCAVSSTTDIPTPLPPGVNQDQVIDELQQYASTIRAIDSRARQLNAFVLWSEGDPCAGIRRNAAALHRVFELPAGLPNLAQAADERTSIYQEVRYFAQSLLDDTSSYYGAISACILPALYALLGTCAYLLRSFEQQLSARTFVPSGANFARFLIAGIAGAVVGLFHNLTISQGASVSPLALAFMVGYAVDVFFAFLEGLLQSFTRNATAPDSPAKS